MKLTDTQVYEQCNDLWIITSYFNPCHYKTKHANFELFEKTILDSNLKLLTVECAFEDDDFELPPSPHILQVRCSDVLWQRERLLNLAINSLSDTIKKIAWIDCDIMFLNKYWAVQTSELLEQLPIVQPFQTVTRLSHGVDEHGESWDSFGYVTQTMPGASAKVKFDLHGHTGFAWAARMEILRKYGLYDGSISGGVDHLMAHAMLGEFDSPCLVRIVGSSDSAFRKHFLEWAAPFYMEIKGQLGYIPGSMVHLWHGDDLNRKYLERHESIRLLGYNPYTDLRIGKDGLWEWNSHKPELHAWARNYFKERKEDG
ncbi:MAG: hypothetical protein M5U11_00820 [Anaerolineales bacterium]|nr:hypothetical protein [Anaerolineales bacterium]